MLSFRKCVRTSAFELEGPVSCASQSSGAKIGEDFVYGDVVVSRRYGFFLIIEVNLV